MTDIVDKATRSRMMAGIRSKNTKPELLVRSWLHRQGLRFRLHGAGLPGRPDLVFRKYRSVVFVHGCFWHRHPGCRYATTPSSNAAFWQRKLRENVARDKKRTSQLRSLGWRVLTIWECQIGEPHLRRLSAAIHSRSVATRR